MKKGRMTMFYPIKELVLKYIAENLHADPADMTAEPIAVPFFQQVAFWRAGDFSRMSPNIKKLTFDGTQVAEVQDDGFQSICKIEGANIRNSDDLIKYLKFYFQINDTGEILSGAEDIAGISPEQLEKWQSLIHPIQCQWSHLGGQATFWLWDDAVLYWVESSIDASGCVKNKKMEMERDIGVVITLE
jgi:hypothetical protein